MADPAFVEDFFDTWSIKALGTRFYKRKISITNPSLVKQCLEQNVVIYESCIRLPGAAEPMLGLYTGAHGVTKGNVVVHFRNLPLISTQDLKKLLE